VKLIRRRPAPERAPVAPADHPRTLGWVGTTALAMGGSNQSLFVLGALLLAQGSAAIPLLAVGLFLSWMAMPGWIELILMWPNRVGGIAASCAEAFRPYSPVLANLTGVCYWWGWVPTCGLTAILSASALHQWYLPGVPVHLLACAVIVVFTLVNLAGVKWVARFAVPFAATSAVLAMLSAVVPVVTGRVDWQRATSFHLITPFHGLFGSITSAMAGLYLIGFAAPAFEAAACHVGETIDPKRNVPRAMYASAGMATLFFVVLPVVWLGALGVGPLTGDLALTLGPTFGPLLVGGARSAAIAFMVFNMFHGSLQPLAGAARTLMQLADDGLLPRVLGWRMRSTDAPWVATLLTAAMAILFLQTGDPTWVLAAANLTYLIGICLPSVAVWLLRRNEPDRERLYRAPRGTITLGLVAAVVWGASTVLGFQQFGLPTVLAGLALAYSGSALYAVRVWCDRRREGKPGLVRSLHMKLTGAMLLVLTLDGIGYLLAVSRVDEGHAPLVAALEDIFVAVALLTISVGLVLPGLIGHAVGQVATAADRLATGTLGDLKRAIEALGRGDLGETRLRAEIEPVNVRSRDEIGAMGDSFNLMQREIVVAASSLAVARDEQYRATAGLARVSRQNELLLDSAGEAIFGIDPAGAVTFMNPAASRLVGYSSEDMVGRNLHATVHHSHHDGSPFAAAECPIVAMLAGGTLASIDDDVFWDRDGRAIPVRCTATPIAGHDGEIAGAVLVASDMSEQRRLEAEIRQSQKMDAVGQLAGGIAHDFNNLLTAISGYSELALARVDDRDAELRGNVEEIQRAAGRAASLTQQLLAFSRQQVLQPTVLSLNRIVLETGNLLGRLLGEDVTITTSLDPDLRATKIDEGQLAQILVNLAVNARDAMRRGGTLTIETANAGDHVVLTVRDTGCGMDAKTQARIFEPFFTTKGPGTGTGLGLATVYGIVNQTGGEIQVESEPGRGTAFRILLPATGEAPTAEPVEPERAPGGRERVLLVEDEEIVRRLLAEILRRQGYDVAEAAEPVEALQHWRAGRSDVLVTDVVMPEMSGPELAERLLAECPDLRVVYMSGYTSGSLADSVLTPGVVFLQKPFRLDELALKVREVLDAPPSVQTAA
jgi:PAS domain S-box-containing protein